MSEKEIKTMDFGGGSYTGEVADGKPHGRGRFTNPQGSFYEGDWVDGEQHGYGKAKYYDSHGKYIGEFEGEFEKDTFKRGKWSERNKNYEGDFLDGRPHGYGVMKWDCNLHYYKGEWNNGRYHGKGIRHDYDGTWDGEWVNGRVNGNGTFTSKKGWTFSGRLVEADKVEGEGRLTLENGDIYEGEVASYYSVGNISMHGHGRYIYKDGRVYEGEFHYGRRKEDVDAEIKARQEEERRQEEKRKEAERREAEERAKDPVAYDLAMKKARRAYLEKECAVLIGHVTDIRKRFGILSEAYFQAHNSNFNDHMAWEALTGRNDSQIEFWQNACRLKYEVEALAKMYEEELKEQEG